MSKRGENIYKRKDDRWEGRYIKDHDYMGKPRFGYVYAKTYREVKEKLNVCRQTPVTELTQRKKFFGAFCDEWLLICRSRVKESTFVKYHTVVTNHIKPRLEWFLPQSLNTVVIEEFSHGLLADGLSVKTVRDILTVLRSIFNYCRRQIGASLSDIEIVYPKERQKEMRVLTLEEQTKFIQYLLYDLDTAKFGVLLALLTGMRIGEICALKWGDISLEDKTVHIGATMQRLQILDEHSEAKTHIVIGDTKSQTSNRIIPLTEYAVALCTKMTPKNNSAYILTGESQHYLEPRALQYRLRKYTDACGLCNVHFHVLRHTFATRCVEVGFEIKSLSEILGHSSAKVTLDRYVHSSLELKRSNMDKLSAVGF